MKKILLTLTPLLLIMTAQAQTAYTAKTKTAKTADVVVTINSPAGGSKDKNQIFTSVEQVPEFPGGLNAFSHFLTTNIRYPETARKNKKQGRVIVTMVIEKDGTVTDVKIARGVSDDLDAEALRVINLSPKWAPAYRTASLSALLMLFLLVLHLINNNDEKSPVTFISLLLTEFQFF